MMEVRNEAKNWSASIDQIAEAIEIYTDNTKSADYDSGTMSFDDIFDKVESSNCSIVAIEVNNHQDTEHALAIFSVDKSNDSMGYVDPDTGDEHYHDFDYMFSGNLECGGLVYFEAGEW